jgi:hypothetical protein
MSSETERLYELLPAVYRIRDAEQGEPLKALVSVVANQLSMLKENMEQLYDDQFIETCADWVVPYIGDLIGYRSLYGVVPAVSSPRAEVAHTIGYRRRKGTASMLEQLARDVTGWSARPVEFFQILSWTQYMNHIRPNNFYAPDMRLWEPLERLNTPFDRIAHTVDVRHISRGLGLYNIPNIGIFLWRLFPYSLTGSPAFSMNDGHRYLFNPLGLDSPLFTNPTANPLPPQTEILNLSKPINEPMPISRRVLDQYLDEYYGDQKSMSIEGPPISNIIVCDLSGWIHAPPAGKIALDPVLGRIWFADTQTQTPLVNFHYGFSAPMGGGEYDRSDAIDDTAPTVKIPANYQTIQAALSAITGGGVAEVYDTGRYAETLSIAVNGDKQVELRALNLHRPTIVLGGDFSISGGTGSEAALNGLLLTGAPLEVNASGGNQLATLRLVHCTISPNVQPSLIVGLDNVRVEIDHCILGAVQVTNGSQVQITDSIIDAIDQTKPAYTDPSGAAGGTMQVENSTIIGTVHTQEMALASNTIFLANSTSAPVRSEIKQSGCVRFCYLPLSSIVPRRYRCQPTSDAEALRVRPQFTSLKYGDPGYCQLSSWTAKQIRAGADDGAEMGAFHDLFEPQRETNLRIRLEEYLRFKLEAGVFYVT